MAVAEREMWLQRSAHLNDSDLITGTGAVVKATLPLSALALCAFGIGVTEFAPMGLLPLIASDLGITIPAAGLLVTGYALGVMLGAPVVTLLTLQIPRQRLLILLMAVFTAGNFLAFMSVNFSTLLVARLITSLCHGALFGVGSMVAASLVPIGKRAGAIATMFMGLTVANIGGVPLAAWIGQVAGWRVAFMGITGLGIIAMIVLQLAVPRIGAAGAIDVWAELRALRRPAVITAMTVTVLASGAMFTVFTYIAPIVHEQTHGSPSFLTAILMLYGIGLTVGNWLGGRYADRSIDATLIVVLASLSALLLVFAGTMSWPVPAAISIFAWGIATFALVPPLQMQVLTSAAGAPTLASSMNIGAFNLGNALGAAIGGAVITFDLGYQAISIAGALLSGCGLAVVLATRGHPVVRAAHVAQESSNDCC
jgi:DHA1 family inner membrane transport protein